VIEIKQDIGFIEKLQKAAGSQLTTCMQCGACTASCTLSEDQNVFPRKQMILAAWGMKEQLMADPHIWSCHQCGDCTVSCPRGVKPGDVLAALRMEQISHYSRPRFLVRLMQKPAFLPVALLFPVAIIILILTLAGTFRIPEGPVNYAEFFPHGWLNGSFTALFILSTVGILAGLRKFSQNLGETLYRASLPNENIKRPEKVEPPDLPVENADGNTVERQGENPGPGGQGQVKAGFVDPPLKRFFSVVGRIMKHRDFARCDEHKSRSVSHFLVFWGFILLLFVTFFAILSTIFFEYPLGILNPIKIAGNTGALMLLAGSSLMILNRLFKSSTLRGGYPDWFFLVSFWMLTVSGILVEAARFLDWDSAYHLYFIHLVMVWIIILYYPYTKFAHFLYRTVALYKIRKIL
jgi:quinone-modifying oxidoreductase subunit QmoC